MFVIEKYLLDLIKFWNLHWQKINISMTSSSGNYLDRATDEAIERETKPKREKVAAAATTIGEHESA